MTTPENTEQGYNAFTDILTVFGCFIVFVGTFAGLGYFAYNQFSKDFSILEDKEKPKEKQKEAPQNARKSDIPKKEADKPITPKEEPQTPSKLLPKNTTEEEMVEVIRKIKSGKDSEAAVREVLNKQYTQNEERARNLQKQYLDEIIKAQEEFSVSALYEIKNKAIRNLPRKRAVETQVLADRAIQKVQKERRVLITHMHEALQKQDLEILERLLPKIEKAHSSIEFKNIQEQIENIRDQQLQKAENEKYFDGLEKELRDLVAEGDKAKIQERIQEALKTIPKEIIRIQRMEKEALQQLEGK